MTERCIPTVYRPDYPSEDGQWFATGESIAWSGMGRTADEARIDWARQVLRADGQRVYSNWGHEDAAYPPPLRPCRRDVEAARVIAQEEK